MAQFLSEEELLPIIGRYDGMIAGDDALTERVLRVAKRLKVIAKWGVGVDAIDLHTAEEVGIEVLNTPGQFAEEVADVVVGYMIMLARRLHELDQSVRRGEWAKIRGLSLQGKNLGVVGLGSIGRAVLHRASAMGMALLGYDPAPLPDSDARAIGLRQVSLDELVKLSDFISLNCSLTSSNVHMIDARAFSLMRRGVYLINTARGPLIDEQALVEALRDGKVAGAALDVFEKEPLPPNSPLREFRNCVFGTHNASNSEEAVKRVHQLAIQNLLRGLGMVER